MPPVAPESILKTSVGKHSIQTSHAEFVVGWLGGEETLVFRMDQQFHRLQLIHILQAAYSGELAAANAYRGHWKSSKDPVERSQIQKIEQDEWTHRERVGEMLAFLEAEPVQAREIIFGTIGRTLGMGCYLSGWFFPMYFAGRLECSNVQEYNHAAFHAGQLGLVDFEQELFKMAAVEQEHEDYFFEKVTGHVLLPLMKAVFRWGGVPKLGEPKHASQKLSD